MIFPLFLLVILRLNYSSAVAIADYDDYNRRLSAEEKEQSRSDIDRFPEATVVVEVKRPIVRFPHLDPVTTVLPTLILLTADLTEATTMETTTFPAIAPIPSTTMKIPTPAVSDDSPEEESKVQPNTTSSGGATVHTTEGQEDVERDIPGKRLPSITGMYALG